VSRSCATGRGLTLRCLVERNCDRDGGVVDGDAVVVVRQIIFGCQPSHGGEVLAALARLARLKIGG